MRSKTQIAETLSLHNQFIFYFLYLLLLFEKIRSASTFEWKKERTISIKDSKFGNIFPPKISLNSTIFFTLDLFLKS